MKLLYIEDDERLAVLVCMLLKSHGYEVEHFARGKPGLDRFYLALPSWGAVIIDLDLPDISGRTLIAEMAKQCPTLPIVVYSGMNGTRFGLANRFELFSAGASAVLWKPSGGEKLLGVLRELIDTRPIPTP